MKLFGTDGVRGEAGTFLDAMTVLKLAKAAGIYFRKHSTTKRKITFVNSFQTLNVAGHMLVNA